MLVSAIRDPETRVKPGGMNRVETAFDKQFTFIFIKQTYKGKNTICTTTISFSHARLLSNNYFNTQQSTCQCVDSLSMYINNILINITAKNKENLLHCYGTTWHKTFTHVHASAQIKHARIIWYILTAA